ncbi:MAG: hypothetical protein JW929_06245 [Anaerolineales bacterium]|nr:hypothetical protein [Anaerolineales bacterium]
MLQEILLSLGFLAVLCVPSTNLQFFDGLPLSNLPEFSALALAVAFFLFPELRGIRADFWGRWNIRPQLRWIFLAFLIVFKTALFASGEKSGFAACYRSPAEPTTVTHESLPFRQCEPSYENLFDRFSATRLDKAIWFGEEGWNLTFLNTNRYDYLEWEPGNILRSRIPIAASWSGYPDLAPGEAIRVDYVGEGEIVWGDVRVLLPPSYAGLGTVEVEPPQSESLLQIEYVFDDGSRSGQDPESWGPRATVKVSAAGEPGVPLSARDARAGWRFLGLLADGGILLWMLSGLLAVWVSVRADRMVLAVFTAGLALLSWIPLPVLLAETAIALALTGMVIVHVAVRPFRPPSVFFCVLAAAFAVLVAWSSGFGQVLLRSAGNDPLQYESQAFSILATGSLRAGESVFYFQPMYRYVRFLEHLFFGDANTFSSIPPLAAYWGAGAWLFHTTRRFALPKWKKGVLLAVMTSIFLLGGMYVSGAVRAGLSEYPTWILLMVALPWMLTGPVGIRTVLGCLAIALSASIRVNQLPAVLWLLAVSAVRIGWRRWRLLTAALVGASAVGSLPLLHNLIFGRTFVPFTWDSTSSVFLALPPAAWLSFFRGDPEAASAVAAQMKAIFLLDWVPMAQRPMLAAMAVLLACWLIASGHSLLRRAWREWTVLVLPCVFLAPHLFYNVTGYYPKYIFIAYLCMGIALPVVWMRAAGEANAKASDSRPGLE